MHSFGILHAPAFQNCEFFVNDIFLLIVLKALIDNNIKICATKSLVWVTNKWIALKWLGTQPHSTQLWNPKTLRILKLCIVRLRDIPVKALGTKKIKYLGEKFLLMSLEYTRYFLWLDWWAIHAQLSINETFRTSKLCIVRQGDLPVMSGKALSAPKDQKFW